MYLSLYQDLRASPVVISILSLYVHYSATLYLFFYIHFPAALFIHSLLYLNIISLLFFFLIFLFLSLIFLHSLSSLFGVFFFSIQQNSPANKTKISRSEPQSRIKRKLKQSKYNHKKMHQRVIKKKKKGNKEEPKEIIFNHKLKKASA